MSEATTIALITAGSTVLVALITQQFFWPLVVARKERKREEREASRKAERERQIQRKQKTGMWALTQAQNYISAIPRQTTNIDRAVLFEGHNGGGPPSPASPYYTRVLYPPVGDKMYEYNEHVEDPTVYQELVVDASYTQMLSAGFRVEHQLLMVDEMKEGSLLAGIYRGLGVKWSIISLLCIYENSLIYMSQAGHTDVPTDADLSAAAVNANHVKGLMLMSNAIPIGFDS